MSMPTSYGAWEGRSLFASCALVNSTPLSASTSTTALVDSLAEGKSGLHKLPQEFSTESPKLLEELNAEASHLESELIRVHRQLSVSKFCLASERKNAARDRAVLAKALVELERLMVSRCM
jgi:hypothetical protein